VQKVATQIDAYLSTLSKNVTIGALKDQLGGGEAGGLFRDALVIIKRGTVNWADQVIEIQQPLPSFIVESVDPKPAFFAMAADNPKHLSPKKSRKYSSLVENK
jgi:hypothetical protein